MTVKKTILSLLCNAGDYKNGLKLTAVWLCAGLFVIHLSFQLLQMNANEQSAAMLLTKYDPVASNVLNGFAQDFSSTYNGISIKVSKAGEVIIAANDTDYFPRFLSVINYFQSVNKNWRIETKHLCAGRDCAASGLYARLNISAPEAAE